MNKLFKNSVLNIIFRLLTALSLAVILVLISRTFGTEGKGIFAMLYFIPLLAFNLGHLGIGNANVYIISKDPSLAKKALFNSLLEGLILGLLFTSLFFLIAKIYPAILYGKLNSYYIYLALLSIPFIFWERFLQGIFVGKQEFKFFNIATFFNKLLVILILILQIYVWEHNINQIALSYVLITIALPIIFIIYLLLKQKNIWVFDWTLFKNTLDIGFRSFLACTLAFLVIRSDVFMINFLKELGDVGLYSLAVNFTDEILLIASSIALALFPHINEKPEQSLEITLKTTRILSLFLIIILTMSAILIKPVIFYFFGKNFMGSLPSFYILTLAIYFLSICTIISQFFASKSFPWKAILAWLPGLILNIILNLIFIPKFGIIVAAATSLLAYIITFLIYVAMLKKYQALSIEDVLIPNKKELTNIAIFLKNIISTKHE